MNPSNPINPNNSVQQNFAQHGGNVFANQGPGNQIINNTTQQAKRGTGFDTKALLVILVLDVAFFFYGMTAYTGRNTTADTWRAGIFILLLILTASLVRRWLRRRV